MEEIEFLIGDKIENVEALLNQHSFEVFSEDTINFLSNISNVLLKSPEIGDYPDVATFAFYCRKSNLNLIKKSHLIDSNIRIGRGILFHITPGNVPVNFAYSFFAGLVTGNINIVRVPSRKFKQVDLIIQAIKTVLKEEKYKSIFSNRLYLVRYNIDSNITALLSSFCDVRVIWGGDNTINEIRKSRIPPKSTEITFSDRYSIAIINAENYLECLDKIKLSKNFYNDTYLFDQNACTSPQTIYWLGSPVVVKNAQEIFWGMMQNTLEEEKFEMQPILSVDKLTIFYSQAILQGSIKIESKNSNGIFRVKNYTVRQDMDLFKCSSGYFNEVIITSLDELVPVISRKFQTIGYYGFSKKDLLEWFIKSRPLGVDRVVPIGRTMDFSLFWDGYDLLSALSRRINFS